MLKHPKTGLSLAKKQSISPVEQHAWTSPGYSSNTMTAQPEDMLGPKSELPAQGLPAYPFCPRPELRERQLSFCPPLLLTAFVFNADYNKQPLALRA